MAPLRTPPLRNAWVVQQQILDAKQKQLAKMVSLSMAPLKLHRLKSVKAENKYFAPQIKKPRIARLFLF
jgi:hypothetical protein